MSNCTFQSQLVSIMEILAKAAVAEINKRVNDSCAVIRLEMRRSQRDVDALKRKYHLLENEVRRTRGRARKKVPMYVISDRYTPTASRVCVEEEEGGGWREESVSVTLNSDHTQPSLVEEPCLPATDTAPLIKVETEEDNMWANEEGQVTFSHQEVDGSEAAQEETKAARNTVDGQHDTHTTHTTHTGQEGEGEQGGEGGQVSVEVLVKVEDGRRTEEEEAKEEEELEERSNVPATEEQQQQQQEQEQEFILEQHSAPVWTTSVSDFMTDTYTHHHHHHVQPLSLPAPQPQPQSQLVVPAAGALSLPSGGGSSGGLLLGRTRGHHGRWGGDSEQCHPPNNPRMLQDQYPHASRSQLSLRPAGSSGGPSGLTGLGLGGFRGNSGVGGFGSSSSSGGGFHSSALRRLRPHQWRSVGAVGSAMASSSSSSSSSSSTALACVGALERSRVFACQFCPKSFARLSQLKEHLRSHTGERPFSCVTCGRRFTKHCNLLRHAVVHSGEKPYRCPTCHKCFTQSSSLKSHQRTHLLHHAAAPPAPRREGALLSRVQLRGALMSGGAGGGGGGGGVAQGYRAFT